MTELEKLVAGALHRKLDRIPVATEIPPSVMRRTRRGRALTVSTGVMTLLLLLVGSAWFGAAAFDRSLNAASNAPCPYEPAYDMTVYVRDEATREHIQELSALLSTSEEVKEVTFLSKAQVFAEFRKRYEDQPEFYENLPRNALPARFDVQLEEDVDPTAFAKSLPRVPAIDDVRYAGRINRLLCRGD